MYPGENASSWRIQAVPVSPESFESRKALPEPWRGIRDGELSALTGIDGCIFVHASGFTGGEGILCIISVLADIDTLGNATEEGALTMARQALTM